MSVVRDSQNFSGHPYVWRIARSSLRQLSFLVYKSYGQESCIKKGVLKVAQFKGVIQIYQRLTLVAVVTKIWEFYYKMGYNSAYIRVMAKKSRGGVFNVAQFNSLIEI